MAISDRMKRMHNCVGISFDKGKEFAGKLYICYQEEGIPFVDVDEFFIIVNAFLDTIEFPAQKIKYRNFKKTLPTLKIVDIHPDEKLYETEHLLDVCGKDAYVLMVIGRDNATWQGMIYNNKEDKEYSFNSELELLKVLRK